ncbi:hypothetical protein [Sandaracinus amylolyticus]|uniref:Uncharacterized protein n=1 Tax=Sandaracinus amylolyticus TaxID=927083 RepID=A0A0F6W3K0_9BACT|nr:hypothetical protein [Sandaracinus amylolyticus]AKF06511.1 hypothetical protein DB32_003660 [Sandaracinus amylolyticus]
MRGTKGLSVALTALLSIGCGGYACGELRWSADEGRCVCPAGTTPTDTGTCVSADGGPTTGDAGADAAANDAAVGDAGPPSAPECETALDCDAPGLVECVARRCVFCARSSGSETIREGVVLRPALAVDVRRAAGSPPVALVATMGEGSAPALLHRFEVERLDARTDVSLTDAARQACPESGAVESVAFDTRGEMSGVVPIIGVVLAEAGGLARAITMLEGDGDRAAALTGVSSGCRRRTAPAAYLPSSVMTDVVHVVREQRADASTGLVALEQDLYVNVYQDVDAEVGDADEGTRLARIGEHVLVAGSSFGEIVWWHASASGASAGTMRTPGRTGDIDAAFVAPGSDAMPARGWLTYPVDDRVRFVEVDCDRWACRAVGESAELVTGAARVLDADVDVLGGRAVVLSAERGADGRERVMLRVLRGNRAPFDAPSGGREIALGTAPDGARIASLALDASPGSTPWLAVAWIVEDAGARSSAHAQTFAATCAR